MGAGLIGIVTGLLTLPVAGPFLMGLCGFNLLLSVVYVPRIHTDFNLVSPNFGEINHYYRLVEQIHGQTPRPHRF